MLGFVVLHLAGNLLAFAGSGTFNAYARSLREMGTPVVGYGALLWFARAVLAGALALHLVAHAYLMREPTSGLLLLRSPTAQTGGSLKTVSLPAMPTTYRSWRSSKPWRKSTLRP